MSESKDLKDLQDPTGGVQDMRVAALKYNADEDYAPVVVAAGSGYVAQRIIEIADECGIAVYHDDSAATLLSKLNLGQQIPGELYQMVVDIYMTVLAAAKSSKGTLNLQMGNRVEEELQKRKEKPGLTRDV